MRPTWTYPSRWTLPVRLGLLVATLLVPLVISSFIEERAELERRRATEIRTAIDAAESGAATIDAFLRDLENTMATLSLTLAESDLRQSGPVLTRVAGLYPELRSLFATDAAARVIAASTGEGIGTDLTTRPYMVRLREGEEQVWSGSLAGLQSGEITVAYGRRVGSAASPRGHLIAAFYPERVLRGMRLRLPPDARVRILDERGTPIYATDQEDGGRADFRASAAVRRTGWTIEVLRPEAELEATVAADGARRELQRAGLIAALALAAAWMALRIARPIRRLTRDAEAIARGERPDIAPTRGGPEISALRDAMRTMLGAVAAREDEAARLDRELREALRTRDEFMAAVAHDVRTPLTILRATAQLMERRVGQGRSDPDEIREATERISSAVSRVDAQIAQLLDLSHARAGRPVELDREPTDIVALAVRVRGELQDLSPDHRITLRADMERLVGEWDALRLERALVNLLTNAVKFSPRGGEVTLRVGRSADGTAAEIEVRDQGSGIPRAELDRVRMPFYRASNATGTRGSGIGLAVVDQVVTTHGGTLDIQSEQGAGTTVRIALPLAPANERSTTSV